MSKTTLTFKIISITFLILNIVAFLFLGLSYVLTLAKVWVVNNFHLISFIVVMELDLIYSAYLCLVLILNKVK